MCERSCVEVRGFHVVVEGRVATVALCGWVEGCVVWLSWFPHCRVRCSVGFAVCFVVQFGGVRLVAAKVVLCGQGLSWVVLCGGGTGRVASSIFGSCCLVELRSCCQVVLSVRLFVGVCCLVVFKIVLLV